MLAGRGDPIPVIPAKAGIHYEATQTPWAVVGSAVPLAFTRTRYNPNFGEYPFCDVE
jgi:hypothetical protein